MARRQIRKRAPRLPSLFGVMLGEGERSGVMRRRKFMVRRAVASLIVGERRVLIRVVVISCIAVSACFIIE